MNALVAGERVAGSYLLLVDVDGRRHALRPAAILAISDADESQSATCVLLPGSRLVRVEVPLETVLRWLGEHHGEARKHR